MRQMARLAWEGELVFFLNQRIDHLAGFLVNRRASIGYTLSMFTNLPSALGLVTTRHGKLRMVPSPMRSERSGKPAYEIYLANSLRLPNSFRVWPLTSKLRNSLLPPHVPFMPPTLSICAGTEPLPLFCCMLRCSGAFPFSCLNRSVISVRTPISLSALSLTSLGESLSTGYESVMDSELILSSWLTLRLISIFSPVRVSSTSASFLSSASLL